MTSFHRRKNDNIFRPGRLQNTGARQRRTRLPSHAKAAAAGQVPRRGRQGPGLGSHAPKPRSEAQAAPLGAHLQHAAEGAATHAHSNAHGGGFGEQEQRRLGTGARSHAGPLPNDSPFNPTLTCRGRFSFPPRFTANALNRQLSIRRRSNHQFCDPESSISEVFRRSSSSCSLSNISPAAGN